MGLEVEDDMVEFHGWAVVRSSAKEQATSDDLHALDQLLPAGGSGVVAAQAINGEVFLWCAGLRNHRDAEFAAVHQLFSDLASRFPGSYGLLYFRDDEGHDDPNGFRVVRLVRGQLSEAPDEHLSPCVPTIEDEDSA
jgi:hypothetical protein